MALSNPAFSKSPEFSKALAFSSNTTTRGAQLLRPQPVTLTSEKLDELYGRPAASPVETDRMSYEDTIVKTAVSFALLLGGAAIGWLFPVLALPAALVGFVLALVNIFKKRPSAALVLLYAAVEGVFVGGISAILENLFAGIVVQAVLATLSVFAVTLFLFASGKIRASAKATKVFVIAMAGYALYSIVNFGLMVFGGTDGMFGINSMDIPGTNIPFGVVIGILAILMAAYSLVLDFDFVQRGVQNGAQRVFGWRAAFGLVMTVVWLYVEFLRLIALFRGSD